MFPRDRDYDLRPSRDRDVETETTSLVGGVKHKRGTGSQVAILDLSKALSQKQCKMGGKLVLIANRKSYMSFRLVSKSVTLNYLERCSGCFFCVISATSVAFSAHCVKVVEDIRKLSATEL